MERPNRANQRKEVIMSSKIKYPYLKTSEIEKESIKLLNSFARKTFKKLSAPIPVFDIIEFLGYDIDFRKDGIYQDTDILGGTLIEKKTVQINENISDHEGRMHFTAAHEIGHIILHAPLFQRVNNVDSDQMIISRKDGGFEGGKKQLEEWQADKFAAFLLMPSKIVKKTFYNFFNNPINVRKKRLIEFIFPKPTFVKGYEIADTILKEGKFNNVSKMAMLNRLIGMRLVKGLSYQKGATHKKKRRKHD
jgi:Zn-dependent peptidase ImmA (M78 family)